MIDGFKVADLPDRYGIGRTALYDRLKKLNIKPLKPEGINGSIITADQLQALDRYDLALKQGTSLIPALAEQPTDGGQLEVMGEIVNQLCQPAGDRLSTYRELQEAVDQGWWLPTSMVRDMLGVAPHGASFERWGFRFVPAAKHRSTEWRVERIG
jgi:hypothetical protein